MTTDRSQMLFSRTMDSPVGPLKLVASDSGVVAILWHADSPRRVRLGELVASDDHPVLRDVEQQLNEYFAGERKAFNLPLAAIGTEFQRRVWAALATIPYGETRSYADIARQIGSLSAVRAVGAANGRNPISIVVPCHRVIGSTGELTGFAGGLDAKAFLLSFEARLLNQHSRKEGDAAIPVFQKAVSSSRAPRQGNLELE